MNIKMIELMYQSNKEALETAHHLGMDREDSATIADLTMIIAIGKIIDSSVQMLENSGDTAAASNLRTMWDLDLDGEVPTEAIVKLLDKGITVDQIRDIIKDVSFVQSIELLGSVQ